jgi:hypothetical protein
MLVAEMFLRWVRHCAYGPGLADNLRLAKTVRNMILGSHPRQALTRQHVDVQDFAPQVPAAFSLRAQSRI